MQRTCSRCGFVYAVTDTIVRCTNYYEGSHCMGEVLPPVVEPAAEFACLVCKDEGSVVIAATDQHKTETRPCSNPGCKAKAWREVSRD